MSRRPYAGAPMLLAIGASVAFQFIFAAIPSVALAIAPVSKPAASRTALGGFVKDSAMARVLGETLFRDTVEVMSDSSNQPTAIRPSAAVTAPAGSSAAPGTPAVRSPDPSRDNSAAGQVARTVLAHETLDKYLWLIQQAYDDTLWKGGDRARIEQHFPLIWRTSIMLYEASLNASPHRVRVCTPADDGESFDCRDEIERARIVPIPAQAPLVRQLHQATLG